MSDPTPVIAVINAGSSSLKFSLYEPRSDGLGFLAGGQIEALFTAPRLIARAASGVAASVFALPPLSSSAAANLPPRGGEPSWPPARGCYARPSAGRGKLCSGR